MAYYDDMTANVKADLGIIDNEKDAIILRKIKQAEAEIEGYTGIKIHDETITETISLYNEDYMVLKYPAREVTTIYYHNTTDTADITVKTIKESGVVELDDAYWGIYDVTYTTGYTDGNEPDDIKTAVLIQAKYDFQISINGGDIYTTQQKSQDDKVTFRIYPDGILTSVKAILRERKI